MTISEILELKFPGIDLFKDCIVQDDGQGPYIKQWNLEGDIPSEADLEQWKEDLDLEYRQHKARLSREYPTWQEQMDMLYHDQKNNTTIWLDTIQNVKNSNPIPQE